MTSDNSSVPSIAFIGGGNMAEAILGGLYQSHPHSKLRFSELLSERLDYMITKYPGVQGTKDNKEAIVGANIIILAVKPQILKSVVEDLAEPLRTSSALIISIAAGIRTDDIIGWLGKNNVALIRIMPNTPALIGEGAVGLFANSYATVEQKAATQELFSSVSKVMSWVEKEDLIDSITGMSGSGPAYFFLIMEAMESAGIAAGLSPKDAKDLTLQTCLGAARMAQESEDDLATLRRKVTSPKGTTEAAIKSMETADIRKVMMDAVLAATNRSKELSKE